MNALVIRCPACAAAAVTVAWGGHELPIYPSFYPHEIEIKTLAPEQAAGDVARRQDPGLCRRGPELRRRTAGPNPRDRIAGLVRRGADQSGLRSDARTRLRPALPPRASCARLPAQSGFVPHPYPVTPFHGDYLHHADLAAAAKARFSGGEAPVARPEGQGARPSRTEPSGMVAHDADWDAEVVEVDAAELTASAMLVRERLAGAALGANRLVPCRASPGRLRRRCRTETARRIRSAAPRGRRLQRARRAHQSGARPRYRAHRHLPENRRRLHGEARIRQRRVFGRDREHRLRFDRRPQFADLHPHREAQGLSLERLAHARHRSASPRPPGIRSAA